MIITMAAPAACARRLRSAHTRVLKCEVVTITGTRPATCSRVRSVSTSRSSSLSTNCSEKLARMQRPFEPASIMKSRQRRWLSRSSSPSSRNVVGTTGNTPLNRGAIVWLMQTSPELVATFPSRCSRTYGPTCPPRIGGATTAVAAISDCHAGPESRCFRPGSRDRPLGRPARRDQRRS